MTAGSFDVARWFDAVRWLIDVKQGMGPLVVPILDDRGLEIGELRPITVAHLADEALLERFVVWRNQNRLGYLDQRPVTLEGVRRYVEDVVYNPTRITFLAYCEGRPIARMGAVRIGPTEHEADGLVRGERGGGIQFLHHAQVACLTVLFHRLHHQSMISRVLSSNDLARVSCESKGCNMEPVVSQPVYRVHHADGDTFETFGRPEEIVVGASLDTFRLTRQAFFHRMQDHLGFRLLDRQLADIVRNNEGGGS